MSNETDILSNYELDEDDSYDKYESELEKWDRTHQNDYSKSRCQSCGSIIFSSTYSDSCLCGASDFSY